MPKETEAIRIRPTVPRYPGLGLETSSSTQIRKSFEQHHMQREERTVLPLALQILTEDDWIAINAAFEENSNPFLSDERRKNFDQLFALILQRIPSAAVFNNREAKVV